MHLFSFMHVCISSYEHTNVYRMYIHMYIWCIYIYKYVVLYTYGVYVHNTHLPMPSCKYAILLTYIQQTCLCTYVLTLDDITLHNITLAAVNISLVPG